MHTRTQICNETVWLHINDSPDSTPYHATPLSVEGIIWSRQGLHRHATSYNWNKKKEASEGNAASGICESGIGVQTAIQQCQPADGRLAACAGPLVSHQQRNQERRRGDEGFKEGEWLQSLDSSLWRRQILTLRNAAAAGLETPASQLPAASIAVSPSYPRLFILRLLSLTTLTFSLS